MLKKIFKKDTTDKTQKKGRILNLYIESANGLPPMDDFYGAYLKIKAKDTFLSRTSEDLVYPCWDEMFSIPVNKKNSVLIEIYYKTNRKDVCVGYLKLKFEDYSKIQDNFRFYRLNISNSLFKKYKNLDSYLAVKFDYVPQDKSRSSKSNVSKSSPLKTKKAMPNEAKNEILQREQPKTEIFQKNLPKKNISQQEKKREKVDQKETPKPAKQTSKPADTKKKSNAQISKEKKNEVAERKEKDRKAKSKTTSIHPGEALALNVTKETLDLRKTSPITSVAKIHSPKTLEKKAIQKPQSSTKPEKTEKSKLEPAPPQPLSKPAVEAKSPFTQPVEPRRGDTSTLESAKQKLEMFYSEKKGQEKAKASLAKMVSKVKSARPRGIPQNAVYVLIFIIVVVYALIFG